MPRKKDLSRFASLSATVRRAEDMESDIKWQKTKQKISKIPSFQNILRPMYFPSYLEIDVIDMQNDEILKMMFNELDLV